MARAMLAIPWIRHCKDFLHALHLLPKDLRFEHGDGKLASCPDLHLTLLRWLYT